MYYRVAIQEDASLPWQWKSTPLLSLNTVLQWLQVYRALPKERLRIFSSPSREEMDEQLMRENQGLGSPSVTGVRFLQQRLIHSGGMPSTGEAQGYEGMTSIAVSPRTRADERGGVAHAPCERDRSPLEWRRLEYERGAGGDHDVPYHFALPPSMPQVFAWVSLLGKVQRGEVEL